MIESFHDGGWGMFPTLLWGVLLLAVAIRYAIEPAKRFIPLVVSLGVLTMAAGALGFVTGFIKSVRAIAESGAERPVLSLLGAGEAANCIALSLVFLVLAGIATSAGALRLSMRRDTAS